MSEKVKIPRDALAGIMQIRKTGKVNMFDRHGVFTLADKLNLYATAAWVGDPDNAKEYARGIREGFDPQPVEGDLRVWHAPNLPSEGFHLPVADLAEAKLVLRALAEYDLYLGEHVISSNAQGLEAFKDGGWEDWETDDDGRSITEVMDEES